MLAPLRTRSSLITLLVVAGISVLACSSTLDVEDYDRSCATDDDCVLVSVGDICDCSCESGAIAKKDEPKHRADRADISCSNQCGACFPRDVARCVQGTCQAQRCAAGVKSCAPACGTPATIQACECPANTVDILTCS